MAEYDPLTIGDEELKALPPSERAKVYKARAAARAGGGAPAPARGAAAAAGSAAAGSAPAGSAPAGSAPAGSAPAGSAPAGSTSPGGTPPGSAPVGTTPVEASSGSTPGGSTLGVSTSGGAAAPAGSTSQISGTSETASRTTTPAQATAAPTPAAPKEPEKPSAPPFVQHVLDAVEGSSFQFRHGYAELKVPREKLLEAARQLRHDGFDYLSFITEVDWQQHLELIYHLFSYDYKSQPMGAILRCELPRDGMPEVASLTSVWPGAEFMEREAFEMMGITFLGHPDLRRILLPDDFVGFPMRRDFETDWDYVTVKQLVHESD